MLFVFMPCCTVLSLSVTAIRLATTTSIIDVTDLVQVKCDVIISVSLFSLCVTLPLCYGLSK